VLASTVTYLQPVVAVILGALVLAEPITLQLAAGVAIVLAGVALTRRGRPADQPSEASTADSGSN
jgi:drug/metabolite transporter (DMT)-like permease